MSKLCTSIKGFFNEIFMKTQENFPLIIAVSPLFVKPKICERRRRSAAVSHSLLAEALAVGALILGGVGLMGTHQNPVQRAVVLMVAVVSAGLDSAFDALVCIAVHIVFLLQNGFGHSIAHRMSFTRGNNCLFVAFRILA